MRVNEKLFTWWIGKYLKNEIKEIYIEPENEHSKIMLKDVQLFEKKIKKIPEDSCIVSDTRSFSAMRNNTLEHIKKFLVDRLDAKE